MKEVNKQSSPTGISRREFLGMAATGAAALTILPSFTVAGLGHVAPSDKLYIAKIGCGGMGAADLGSLMNTPHKNAAITCLCDVDDRQSVDARKTYPKLSILTTSVRCTRRKVRTSMPYVSPPRIITMRSKLSALCGWVSTYICKNRSRTIFTRHVSLPRLPRNIRS